MGTRLSVGLAMLVAVLMLATGAARAEEPLVLIDPTQGTWHVHDSHGVASFFFGDPGDFPVYGDWDCDGVASPGLYRQRDGFVYLSNANRSQVADRSFFFGNPSDVPLAGDFDGDGCDTISIYRPAEGRIYVINRLGEDGGGLGAADTAYHFGNPGDRPFVGDFDGDGADSVGLYRGTTGFVYFRNRLTSGIADREFFYGDPADFITAGDWNDDGVDSVAIYRQRDRAFYLRFTNSPGVADRVVPFGDAHWVPAGHPGDAAAPPPSCDPHYPTVCIPPPPPDLNCADVPHVDFAVPGADPHGFDGDNDGVGCESSGDTTPPPPPSSSCHPSYPTVCIPPPPPDLDCGEIRHRNFRVVGSDPHRFDGDNDGIGCET